MEANGEIQDYRLDKSVWNLECLKNLAHEEMLPKPRSLAWAILLQILPPLDQPIEKFHEILKNHRDFYEKISSELTTDPRYVIDDDPLSQNDGSAWKQHFCDNELKALILQDVVRTFPDEAYFRDNHVQDVMVRVLFAWSRRHTDIGYRQGMHEVLAMLLYELYLDRLYMPNVQCNVLRLYLENKYFEHDSYMLFNGVMKGIERFYATGDVVPTPNGRLPTTGLTQHCPNEVVRYLEHVREKYLVPLDPELAKHLSDCNVKLEYFGIRWLRLLFGREFPRAEAASLWGYLFSEGPTLPHLHYVVVAMLVAARKKLLSQYGSGVLSVLMRDNMSRAGFVLRVSRHVAAPHVVPHPTHPASRASHNHPASRASHNHPASRASPASYNHDMHAAHHLDSSTESWTISSDRELAEAEIYSQAIRPIQNDADIARALGTLAVVRARLPAAAAALAASLPEPLPPALRDILQLARLLECRNHSFIDVETALEAAEGQPASASLGRRQLVPVAVSQEPVLSNTRKTPYRRNRVKEVPLRLFSQVECEPHNGLPSLDPLRLRTE